MNVRLQVFIIIVTICFFLYVMNLLTKKKIDFRYALGWFALGVIIVFLTVFPNTLLFLSSKLGITSPVNMLFFFGFCLSLCMIFSLSVSLSHANEKIKKLAQEVAILRRVNHEEKTEKE